MDNNFFEYKNNYNRYKHVKSNMLYGSERKNDVLFTIAIPTYKRPLLLENALQSAIDQLKVDDYEIIIVDNDPEHSESENVVQKYLDKNVYYFKNEENIGIYSNWNRCIELAKGKYISILNDDDWLSKNYLNTCQKKLESDKEIDGLYFRHYNVDYRNGDGFDEKDDRLMIKKTLGLLSKKSKKLELFDFFLGNKSAGSLGVLMKTQYLRELGGYNEDYYPSSDYVLHARYCNDHNVLLINKKLNYYRIAVNESAKQETLRKWEIIDNEIRKSFIDIIGKRKKLLNYLNLLIQENRVEYLVKMWGYQTGTKRKYNISRKALNKLIFLKDQLNI